MTQLLQLVMTGLAVGGIYALLGAAIVLVYKGTRVVSLAHGQLLAFGALFFWIFLVSLHLHPLLSLLLALVLSLLMGLIVERLTLRPLIGQPLFAAFLMTFAIYVALDGILMLVLKGQTRAYPAFLPEVSLQLGGVMVPPEQLWGFLIALLFFFLLAAFFKYTKIGLAMRATAEDHQLAQSTGISVKGIFSLIWMISAVVAAISGITLASMMDVSYLLPIIGFKGLVVALFGGLDSLPGALVAGLTLGVLEYLSAGYLDPVLGGGVKEVSAYVMLLFILLVRPYGLFGLKRIERV